MLSHTNTLSLKDTDIGTNSHTDTHKNTHKITHIHRQKDPSTHIFSPDYRHTQ